MTRLALLAALAVCAAPVQAQVGGRALPDLSRVAGAISQNADPGPGRPYRSGLAVPTVRPGRAASALIPSLRASVGQEDGADDAYGQLEAAMPAILSAAESALEPQGVAERDFGVAAGVAFVNLWETAQSQTVPTDPSLVAARTVAAAVAQEWGAEYQALGPAERESAYETLLAGTMLLSGLAERLDEDTAAPLRQAAAETFRAVFGVSASDVSIDRAGRISGLPSAPVAALAVPASPAPAARRPPGDLPPAASGEVQVFIAYTQWFDAMSFFYRNDRETLILFPDGTAVLRYPSEPVAAFTPAAVRAAFEPEDRDRRVGTWRASPDVLELTFAGETKRLVKAPRGGWYDGAETPDADESYDTYFPVITATMEQLLGPWENESVYVSGVPGGATGMIAAGSSGNRVFYADGTFSEDRDSFTSVTNANVGDGFRVGDGSYGVYGSNKGQSAGRWRLDGTVLTVERDGVVSVMPAFIMPEWSSTQTDVWIGTDYWQRPEADD